MNIVDMITPFLTEYTLSVWWWLYIVLIAAFFGTPLLVWLLFIGAFLIQYQLMSAPVLYIYLAVVILFGIPIIRRYLISKPIMGILKVLNFLPTISETEKTAIDAGTVWVDGELFSGAPNFKKILKEPYPELSDEEKAFLNGPVEELCAMIDDWEITTKKEFPKKVWSFLKKEKFFGMIIPKEYGGLQFSALGHSAVIAKIGSRSSSVAITVMVPNSLGPAELLLHYGTEKQKKHYLPRLAKGLEIPCFGLTETAAGSDAGAMSSNGEVFKGDDQKLYLRLNWKKRYITLGAISTVIGLAFKLRDPHNLLEKGPDLGITCALIPADTPGVKLGRRHDPLGIPFYNCPIDGKDVVVSVDNIIGGPDGAGKGWKMLMESLAAGRGISLPATATGGAKLAARVTSAHASIREQFGLPIGKFEGIEEVLARIGGYTYMLDAMRIFTCGGIDAGAKPAVVTAIAKYNATEILRKVVNDAMDVLGGSGISMGPRNLLAVPYIGLPIGVTVEGANILTRTLIIFGQGAIRCHPYAFNEINGLIENDAAKFDKAFWSHLGHVGRNKTRTLLLSLTRGYLFVPPVWGQTARYYRKLNWISAQFAFFADIAMMSLGGNLKRKEKLTGRFADILSVLYLGTAVLRRFEAEGRPKADLPFVHWSLQTLLYQAQVAFEGIFDNMGLKTKLFAYWVRMNPIGSQPSDALTAKVAKQLLTPGFQRDRLTNGIFIPESATDGLGRLEAALSAVSDAQAIVGKVKNAVRSKQLKKSAFKELLSQAVTNGIVTLEESNQLIEAEKLRNDAIQVDEFTLEEYLEN